MFEVLFLGFFSTLFMDLWALFMKNIFGISGLDYRYVGRWILSMKEGVFFHDTIIQTSPQKSEKVFGWVSHYIIGILFAMIFLGFNGNTWFYHPDFGSALFFGIITTVAPFFLMQPMFGFGIAARKTPNPFLMRLKSLMAHTSYGIGLFIVSLFLSYFMEPI